MGSRQPGAARSPARSGWHLLGLSVGWSSIGGTWALGRLELYRRNPKQPVLEAAGRARWVLGRALRRLEAVERRYSPEKVLRDQAKAVVRRIGWRAVARVIPGQACQALRVAVSLAKSPSRVLGHGR